MQNSAAVPGITGSYLCQYSDPRTGYRPGKEISTDALDSLCWVNTRKDSPARHLFDALLLSHQIEPSRIQGYDNEAATPGAVAAAVLACQADAGICSKGLAEKHGILFLPVAQEQYELVMRKEMLEDPRIITLISLIKSPAFKSHLNCTGFYSTTLTGRIRSLSSENIEMP